MTFPLVHNRRFLPFLFSFAAFLAISACSHHRVAPQGDPALSFPEETRLKNIRQLTFGGTNAEAYWSFDGQWLSYQHKDSGNNPAQCDQIFRLSVDGKTHQQVSNGLGRTTCAFYYPNDSRILFSSTHASNSACPAPPDFSKGYVWPIYSSYQIYSTKPDGSNLTPIEPGAPRAYNAETTVCKDGSVVFTSDRGGDLDLYFGKLDSFGLLQDIKQVTNTLGYDGGAVFSPDCKKIVWRASRPRLGKEADEYRALLKKHLVKPTELEIWTANADGSHARQVTRMGVASFAPAFTPDGQSILFASNPRDPHGRHFDLYLIRHDGTGLERVSYSNTFESFPMFSPDGKYLAFSSNRNGKEPRETNVFIADWVDAPGSSFLKDDPAGRAMTMIRTLSDPSMEGREPGAPGMSRALDQVEKAYQEIGLNPFFETYRQPVQVKLREKKQERVVSSENLIGRSGDGCGRGMPVIIGAHLDHLGYGAENSLELNRRVVHPGADDNASGVATLLEAARLIQADPAAKKGCFVFAAFTGEEAGIAGSSQFVKRLKDRKIKPKAMLNVDMAGRLENNKLTVFGSDSALEWKPLVEKECSQRRLTCVGGGDGYGPSDHMAFYIAHVPVLHFFTGPHVDYHRGTDTADKINATGVVQVAEVVAAVALDSASTRQRLTYQKAQGVSPMGRVGRKNSHGAYLGTIPDYATLSSPSGPGGAGAPQGGVPLAGARPGSPADQAGIREGDILLSIETPNPQGIGEPVAHPIHNLNQFTDVLSDLLPGQKIILSVKRKGTIVKLPATVGKRE
jgi:Tol biopolymer transport system component